MRARRWSRVRSGSRPSGCANAATFDASGGRGSRDRFARRLVLVAADVADRAMRVVRRARLADITAVQDQPVVGIAQILLRDHAHQDVLDRTYGLSGRQAGAVGDP